MYTYYIGIGSNLGDREGYLAFAVNQLVGIQGVTGVEASGARTIFKWDSESKVHLRTSDHARNYMAY